MSLSTRTIKTVLLFFFIMNNAFSQNDTVMIDFGSTLSPLPWNNIISPISGQITNLLNSKGSQTGYSLKVVDAFSGVNSNGTQNPHAAIGFPASATMDNFYGNTVLFNNKIEPTGGIEFSGLDISKQYSVVIFASRIASDNRQTCFDIQGQSFHQLCLNPSNNTSYTISDSLYPASDGTINILSYPGTDNNNAYNFYHLSAMKLIYNHVPDTGQSFLTLRSPVGGEIWQAGKSTTILWSTSQTGNLQLEYSTDQGDNWNLLGNCPGYYQSYSWTVPDEPSGYCLVRITSDTLSDISNGFFEISDDTLSCKIVILGSSTAYGAGASVPDSSWVKRFANSIFQNNTRFSTINLAMGGYTTFHIMPDGTSIPSTLPFSSVDTARNITKALSLNPGAIIINMPSNDAYHYISASEQMNNYRIIRNLAAASGVPVWVSTSQPRNYSDPLRRQIQFDVKDSIIEEFGEYAVDFWTSIADTNGYILPQFDVGDGIHLNDDGHRILYERIQIKSLDTLFCTQSILAFSDYEIQSYPFLVYPNPAIDFITIKTGEKDWETLELKLYSQTGILVRIFFSSDMNCEFSIAGMSQGMYFYTLTIDGTRKYNGKLIVMH